MCSIKASCKQRRPLTALVILIVAAAVYPPSYAADPPRRSKAELQQELESFVADYNQLFPTGGVTLTTSYEREWLPDQHMTEVQNFTSNLQRVSADTYEQHGTYEKRTYLGDVLNSRINSKFVQRLCIENGEVVLYAIYSYTSGKVDKYGPTSTERLNNAIGFTDAKLFPNGFQATSFYLLPDGSLGGTRHWSYPVRKFFDTWVSSPQASALAN